MTQTTLKNNLTAHDLAKEQRAISISEFFLKNKHLLGFDNPRKALVTTIKEAVDNSLDACEEIGVPPEIKVKVTPITEKKFKVVIEDNGPGIVEEQVPKIFAKLLYGSKFDKLKSTRGQQGIGICMTPDTLVPLSDGKVLPIRDIVEKKQNNNLFVLAPDLKLGLGRIDRFWKIPAPPEMIKIKTLGGSKIKLTPENPVLVRNTEGFSWKEAKDITKEDYIAIPRKLGTHVREEKLPLIDLLNENVRVDNKQFVDYLLFRLREKYKTWRGVSERFSIKVDQIKGWRKNNIRRRPEKKYIEMFAEDLKIAKEEVIANCTRVGRLGNYVNIPKYISPDFMSFLGFISGDGHIQANIKNRWGNNISFWNNDDKLQDDFKQIVKKLFSIDPQQIFHSKGRGKMHQFSSSLIAQILNNCGVPSGKKFDTFYLKEFLQRKDLLRPYLQALFDCEGSVSLERETVNFMIRNKKMTKFIQLFLLQFGIISRINKVNEDLRIIISSKKNVRKFREEIGFSHPKKSNDLDTIIKVIKKENGQIEKVPFVKKQIRKIVQQLNIPNKEWPFPHLLANNQRQAITFDTLQRTIDFFTERVNPEKPPLELQELYCLLNSDVVWVKVISAKKFWYKENFVYDLTMKDGNNFIANGVLVHNSASVLYSQLTTGKATKILSKTTPGGKAHYFELHIDTKNNEPEIIKQELTDWPDKKTGTRIEIELEAAYQKGQRSIDEYLKQTAIVNPHLYLIYKNPEKKTIHYPRVTNQMPKEAKTIKPHPYGIELGILIRMLKDSKHKKLKSFLTNEFSRVTSRVADQILEKSNLQPTAQSSRIARQEADNLLHAMKETKIMAPPSDCVVPIGEKLVLKGLKKEVEAEFYEAITRPPSVYRGYPFIIEAGIAYGGNLQSDESIRIMRFANRVPLQYQPGGCATSKAMIGTNWRQYGLSQSSKSLPIGPVIVLIHIASVWVPFTSESKEAIANYPEIIKEMRLALQECGRKLGRYIRKRKHSEMQQKRQSIFEMYINEVVSSVGNMTRTNRDELKKNLMIMAKNRTIGDKDA